MVLAPISMLLADHQTAAWLMATLTTASVTLALRSGNTAIVKRLAKVAPLTASLLDDLLLDMLRRTTFAFQLAIGLFAGSHWVTLSPNTEAILRRGAMLILLWQIGRWGTGVVRHTMVMVVDQRLTMSDQAQRSGRNLLQSAGVGFVWGLVALFAMQNVGIEVGTLVTGLGVTTAIVAVAGQQIGSDLLASASIVLDKSFLVGDFIIVDTNYLGTIERIGVIKTQIRSLSGEVISFSNNDLLKSRVRNYRTLTERRIVFDFSVESTTALDRLRVMVERLKSIVEVAPLTRFDRGHWAAFGEHGLRIEVVYYVKSGDYAAYMDAQQAINIGVRETLEELGVRLAVGLAVRTRAYEGIVAGELPRAAASERPAGFSVPSRTS